MSVVTPARLLRKFLIDGGALAAPDAPGGESAWPSVVDGPMPAADDATPADYVALNDYGSMEMGRVLRNGERNSFPLVQVMIRSAAPFDGWGKGQEIHSLCDRVGVPATELTNGLPGLGRVPVALDGENWVLNSVEVNSSLSKIGQEQDTRNQLFSINLQLSLVKP